MRLWWVLLAILGALGVAGLGLELVLCAHEGEPDRHDSPSHAALVPLAPEDADWFGTYQLSLYELELFPDGSYRDLYGPPEEHIDWVGERRGRWTRQGSELHLVPDDRTRGHDLTLGRLEGQLVLLGDRAVWRRIP